MAPLGSKLAQLANTRKQATAAAELTPEDLERIEADKAAAHLDALIRLFQPHIEGFNEAVDASMKLKLDAKFPDLHIFQNSLRLLTVQVASKSARFKRKGDDYLSDDYFTVFRATDGSFTYGRYSAAVEKPFTPDQFAEYVLMEALDLNE
jgi:hypothetical protein